MVRPSLRRGEETYVPTQIAASQPTPYGAAELKRSERPNLLRGLAAAAALHGALLGGYAITRDATAAPPPTRTVAVIVAPPISEPEAPRPAAQPAASPRTRPPSEALGLPTPVEDAVADTALTLASQADFAVPVRGGAAGGVDTGVPGGMGTVPPRFTEPALPEVPVVIVPAKLNENRAPEPFVPVSKMATPIEQVQPEYPPVARQARIEGKVTVQAWVTAEGRVREVRVVRSDNDVFDRAATDAVRRWRFAPAMQGDEPVAVWVSIPIRFRLR